MSTHTTPSPGALRAAEAIAAHGGNRQILIEQSAIIDRETGAAELLAALELLLAAIVQNKTNDSLYSERFLAGAQAEARAAIQRAKEGRT